MELVEALRIAHKRLTTPPARIRDDPEKAASWKSPVRHDLDWSLLVPKGAQRVVEREKVSGDDGKEVEKDGPADPLTIGLVGQPNVGKSSLLNALLGEQRVRASKTPGKVSQNSPQAVTGLTGRPNIFKQCFGDGRRNSRLSIVQVSSAQVW